MSFAMITELHDAASKLYQNDVQNAYTKGKRDIKVYMLHSLSEVSLQSHILFGFSTDQIRAISRFIRSF